MAETTIQVSRETKQRLEKRKHEKESYDTAVRRILDDNPAVLFTHEEVENIARDVAEDVVDSYAGSPY